MRIRALALLAALALVAAACGNDDDPIGIPDADPDTDIEVDDDLAALIERAADQRVRVAYSSTGPDGETEEFVLSQDPPRQAVLFPNGRMVTTEEGTVTCDGEGPGATCFRIPSDDDTPGMFGPGAGFLSPLFAYQTLVAAGLDEFGDTSEATIAGRQAVCVTIEAPAQPEAGGTDLGEATVCVDAETGVLLRFEGTGDLGAQGIEATDVGEPRDEDFELPAEPTDLDMPDLDDFEMPDV